MTVAPELEALTIAVNAAADQILFIRPGIFSTPQVRPVVRAGGVVLGNLCDHCYTRIADDEESVRGLMWGYQEQLFHTGCREPYLRWMEARELAVPEFDPYEDDEYDADDFDSYDTEV